MTQIWCLRVFGPPASSVFKKMTASKDVSGSYDAKGCGFADVVAKGGQIIAFGFACGEMGDFCKRSAGGAEQ